ncbi:MAG: hypothetical protein NTZ05_02985 [Chloroflexi bacterium]|nr:hypothetical protein [Chloroflexota bacterium]
MPPAIDVSLRLALFFIAALSLLAWTGYGPAALLLPARMRPYGVLLLAPLGFCWLSLLSSLLNSTFLPMSLATPLLIVAAGAVNLWVWRRHRPGFPISGDIAIVGVVSLVPFVIAALPLVHAGSTAFVGNQWDLEVYLPITEYLKRYAIGARLDALPNPITTLLNAPDFRGGSGWGFSYVEAAVGTVLGWPSYLTFRPLLHLLMTLSVPCVYVMARVLLAMDRRAALLLAALWSVHGLSIWLASIGLAGHAASFFLLPLALTLSFLALEEPEPRAIVLAGSAVAGLVLSFYTGALPFYALPTAAYGVWLLARGPDRRRTLLGGAALVAAALLLAPVAHLRFLGTLAVYFGKGLSQGWGVAVFSPVAEALGVSPFILIQQGTELGVILGEAGRQSVLQGGWLLTLAAGAAAVVGLWRGPFDRSRYLAVLLPGLAFAAALRFGMVYHYGYFKAMSLLAVFLLAPAAAGAVALWDLPRPDALRRWAANGARLAVVGGTLAFAGALLFTASLSVRYFWRVTPDELPRAVWQVQGLKDKLPPGAPVWVLSRSGFNPRTAGMISYFLMDNPLDGSLETAYGRMTPQQPGRKVEYLAVLDGVQPPELGLDPDAAVWRNELVALYRVPDSWRAAAHLEGGAAVPRLEVNGKTALRLDRAGWSLDPGGPIAAAIRPPTAVGGVSVARGHSQRRHLQLRNARWAA